MAKHAARQEEWSNLPQHTIKESDWKHEKQMVDKVSYADLIVAYMRRKASYVSAYGLAKFRTQRQRNNRRNGRGCQDN